MTIDQIITRHVASHDAFVDYILELPEADYNYSHLNEKWNCGQQLDHINRTVSVLSKGASAPKFMLKWKFGKSNRPSKTFEGVVHKYSKGIEDGFKATGKFVPEYVTFSNRQDKVKKLTKMARGIEYKIGKYSEADMDTIILPHPAMGIMTMREIMYFTIHHVEDHLSQMKRNLAARSV